MDLIEQVKQTLRTALTNPYNVIAENSSPKFSAEVKRYYENFPEQKFLIWAKNPTLIAGLANRAKNKVGLDAFVDNDIDFWKNLKIYETLVRSGDVGKNIELAKFADILSMELKERLRILTETYQKNPSEELKRKIRETEKIEEGITELLRLREEKVKKIQTMLEQKDLVVNELVNPLFVKLLNRLNKKNNPFIVKTTDRIMEDLHNFATQLIEEYTNIMLKQFKNKENPPLENIRRELENDERFKRFLQLIEDPKEKNKLLTSSRHLVFFYQLLKTEDRIINSLKETKEEFIKQLADDLKEIKPFYDEKDNKLWVERLESLKSLPFDEAFEELKKVKEAIEKLNTPQAKGVKELINNFIDFVSTANELEKMGKTQSLFLSNYHSGLYDAIEKYFNYSQKTHREYIKELISLHNFDLLLWKLHKRELTPEQLDKLFKLGELNFNIPNESKKLIKELFAKQLKLGTTPYQYFLNPVEYSKVIKQILYREYGYELYKDFVLTKNAQDLGKSVFHAVRDNIERKMLEAKEKDFYFAHRLIARSSVLLLQSQTGMNFGIKSFSQELTDCIEKGFIEKGGKDLSFIEQCYKQLIERESRKVEKLYAKAREYMEFSLKGVFLAPLGLGLMLYADIRKGILNLYKEDYNLVEKEFKQKLKKLFFDQADNETRDLKLRKFAYDKLGFWSEVVNPAYVEDEKDKIYTEILKDKLKEVVKTADLWKLIIDELAEQALNKTDEEIKQSTLRKLVEASEKGKKEIALTILDKLQEAISQLNIPDKKFQERLIDNIKDLKEEFNQPKLKQLKDYRINKASIIEKIILQDLDKYLSKEQKEFLNKTFRDILYAVTVKELEKELPKFENSFKAQLLSGLDKAKSSIELAEIFKNNKVYFKDYKPVQLGEKMFEQGLGKEFQEWITNLKNFTIVIENPQFDKSLILLFDHDRLDEAEKRLFREDRNKFLLQKFNLTEKQIKDMLRTLRHGLEYSALLDNLIESESFKEFTRLRKKDFLIERKRSSASPAPEV
jgi:hypothetical protein